MPNKPKPSLIDPSLSAAAPRNTPEPEVIHTSPEAIIGRLDGPHADAEVVAGIAAIDVPDRLETRSEPHPDGESDAGQDLNAEVARLAGLSELEYERQREASAKRLAVRPSFLDEKVKKSRLRPKSAPQQNDGPREAEPWPEPVTAAELLPVIMALISQHVVLPPEEKIAIALWIMHTWGYELFEHTPRLAIRSPTKGCGKTTLLDLLERLVHRALQTASITSASVFRTIDQLRPLTLLLDETDTYLARNEELRGVLNSGFSRSGAATRTSEVNGEYKPRWFSTFAPVAFAGIGSLPATLEDRSVPIVLQRKSVNDKVLPLRSSRQEMGVTASKLARWSLDEAPKLNRDPAMPKGLGDRQQDICVPLLAIADQAGGDWPEKARAALVKLFRGRDAEGEGMEPGIQLLADVREVMSSTTSQSLTSAELVQTLGRMEGRPWPEYHHGRPITPNQLAVLLKPFQVRPRDIRKGKNVVKGYRRDDFEEAWTRYLPKLPAPA